MILTLANRITILRILAIPLFVLMLVYFQDNIAENESANIFRWFALAIFCVIAIMDAIDGFLARQRNEITTLGRILDPLADRALIFSAIIFLTRPGIPELIPHFPIWFTILIISRDLMIGIGSLVLRELIGKIQVTPRKTGKASMFLQVLCVIWVLAGLQPQIFIILIVITSVFVIVSWIQYMLDGFRQLANGSHNTI